MQVQTISVAALVAALGVQMLPAQGPRSSNAASSNQFHLGTSAFSSGGAIDSSRYRVVAGFVPIAGRTSSSRYVVDAQWGAATAAPSSPIPWASAATPLLTELGGRTAHVLSGTDLHLGATPSCVVGGVSATVQSRTNARATVRLGAQNVPGWQPIEYRTTAGTTYVPRGIGVFPMLDIPDPFDPGGTGLPKAMECYSRPNDLAVWMFSNGKGAPFVLPGFRHHFELNFGSLVTVLSQVVGSSGKTRVPLPAIAFTRPLSFQVVNVEAPTYLVGSFTNVVEL